MAIFIEKTQSGREMSSRHPCAPCAFSPQACPEETAEDRCDNIVSNLIPTRIIFAPGILFIELCVGESVSKAGRCGDGDAASLIDDYQSALGRLDEVYWIAGDSYGYATESFVKCSLEGRDVYKDFEFSKFRLQFCDVVVALVQATYLTFLESYHFV